MLAGVGQRLTVEGDRRGNFIEPERVLLYVEVDRALIAVLLAFWYKKMGPSLIKRVGSGALRTPKSEPV